MAKNPFKNQPENAYMINMNESWEVIYWCKKFNCTKEQLQIAIQTVGIEPVKVQQYFLNLMN
ncbi:MAG: DUF3606 domain-containing protein [Bacteroidota bacterium]